MKRAKPIWHGQDLQAAIERARKIGGKVIQSIPPKTNLSDNPIFGYWSEGLEGMIRAWERLEFSVDEYAKTSKP